MIKLPFLKNKKEEKESPTSSVSLPAGKAGAPLVELLAPAGMRIHPNYLELGDKFIRTIFVAVYPRYLSVSWFAPVVNLDRTFDVSLYIYPVGTGKVLKKLQKKVVQVGAQISEREEKGLVRDPILETAHQDVEALRDQLQQGTEKFFRAGLYITFSANTLEDLEAAENEITTLLESKLVYAKTAVFQQDQALRSTLPLNWDHLEVHTGFNSGPLSSFFPFVSADLTSNRGVLYGINRHNNSLILFDRFTLENANAVVFAKAGAGKSYTVKLEVLRSMMLGAEVMIVDPESEYLYLAEVVGGSHINISLASPHHINPFDLPPVPEGENPADVLRSHIIELTGLLKVMLGQLSAEEEALVDRALNETYAAKDISTGADWRGKEPPLMGELQQVLKNLAGAESLAVRLEKYVTGSFSGFLNNPTNVALDNQLVVFSIRDLEAELRPVAMYIILHYMWNRIRRQLKKRIMVVDEAWWLMQHPEGAKFLFSIAKRGRKYFLGLTTITQDVEDFMKSEYGKPIVTNSSMQLLMRQSPAAIEIVQKTFNLTEEEKFLLLESNVGDGIFFAGLKRAAIKVVASYTEDQVITSDPAQILEIEEAKKELAEQQE